MCLFVDKQEHLFCGAEGTLPLFSSGAAQKCSSSAHDPELKGFWQKDTAPVSKYFILILAKRQTVFKMELK